jgi:hypothetical protein
MPAAARREKAPVRPLSASPDEALEALVVLLLARVAKAPRLDPTPR